MTSGRLVVISVVQLFVGLTLAGLGWFLSALAAVAWGCSLGATQAVIGRKI